MCEAMNESWGLLAEFIAHRHSLDIGTLNRLLLLAHHSHIEDSLFIRQAEAFLEAVSVEGKANPHLHSQALALIALDGLLFNMYRLARGGEGGFKPASSSFYGWMSMSQLSADASESSNAHEQQQRQVVSLLQRVANSEALLSRRVKLILDRPTNRERNHRYAQNLLETLDYVLSREKCSRDIFLRLRNKLGVNHVKSKAVDFQRVNEVIFSNQLNKVARLLTEGPDELHLALLRIYTAQQEEGERKQFEGRIFTGEDMLYNLHRYYVESFDDENDLFEESKHPLFRFIRNHLIQFYTPFLLSFHTAISKLGLKGDQDNPWSFYKSNEQMLREELLRLIRGMPSQLVDFLRSLSRIIEHTFRLKQENCIGMVKKLLFYCFLCSQGLVEDLLPQLDLAKHSALYSHTLNLFFQTSLRKFTDLPPQKLTLVEELVGEIAGALDQRIASGGSQVLEEDGEPNQLVFRLKDPILNYDYQLVWAALDQIEFTPKDMKKFTMAKPADEPVESPVYKHFRKETSVQLPSESAGETDMAAWMSVGGSREWGQTRQQFGERRSVRERLKGLTTLRGEKVKELNMLRSQFEQYLPE